MDITERIRNRYNKNAKYYDLMEYMMGKGNMNQWRESLWKDVEGKVLEVGVGTGRNIMYYPEGAEVTGIDFSEKMLEKAREKAEKLDKNVELRLMDVENLDFPDNMFDTVVTTCVFCSVPNPIKGLEEIKRVCKKDGKILMLEHVRSKGKIMGPVMDFFNLLTVRIVGANINRDTITNLKHAGLKVEMNNNLMADIVKYIKCSRN